MSDANRSGTGNYTSIIDAVAYHFSPELNRKGAHVWIEEVSARAFILGFSSWVPQRGELRQWLHDQLRRLLRPSVYGALIVKDYSDHRPGVDRLSAVVARG